MNTEVEKIPEIKGIKIVSPEERNLFVGGMPDVDNTIIYPAFRQLEFILLERDQVYEEFIKPKNLTPEKIQQAAEYIHNLLSNFVSDSRSFMLGEYEIDHALFEQLHIVDTNHKAGLPRKVAVKWKHHPDQNRFTLEYTHVNVINLRKTRQNPKHPLHQFTLEHFEQKYDGNIRVEYCQEVAITGGTITEEGKQHRTITEISKQIRGFEIASAVSGVDPSYHKIEPYPLPVGYSDNGIKRVIVMAMMPGFWSGFDQQKPDEESPGHRSILKRIIRSF